MSTSFFIPTSLSSELRQLGQALLWPLGVLAAAGTSTWLGQPGVLALPMLALAGEAVLAHAPLLVAVSVAVGLARARHSVAGLAGAVACCLLGTAMQTIDPLLDMGVLAGLLSGTVAGLACNRQVAIRWPVPLAFLGGVPSEDLAAGVSVSQARAFVAALGGPANLLFLEAGATRLRMTLSDSGRVHAAALRALGACGRVQRDGDVVEVVVGAAAARLAAVISAVAEVPATITQSPEGEEVLQAAAPAAGSGRAPAFTQAFLPTRAARASRAGGFVAALGGPRNLRSVDAGATRLRLQVVDPHLVRDSELKALGALGVIRTAPGSLQVVLGPIADTVADEIRDVMRTAAA